MKRTKQWWAGLTKAERSELHHLERAASNWLSRENKNQNKCNHCNKPRESSYHWLCLKCRNRLYALIKKADKATYFNEIVETNCASQDNKNVRGKNRRTPRRRMAN